MTAKKTQRSQPPKSGATFTLSVERVRKVKRRGGKVYLPFVEDDEIDALERTFPELGRREVVEDLVLNWFPLIRFIKQQIQRGEREIRISIGG